MIAQLLKRRKYIKLRLFLNNITPNLTLFKPNINRLDNITNILISIKYAIHTSTAGNKIKIETVGQVQNIA